MKKKRKSAQRVWDGSLKKHEVRLAREYFEKALQLDPQLIDAYMNLGMLHKETGDFEQAVSCFETSCQRCSRPTTGRLIQNARRELAAIAKMQRSASTRSGWRASPAGETAASFAVGSLTA